MLDAPLGRAHDDAHALASWEQHRTYIAQRVADGYLTPDEAAPLCATRTFVRWMQAALTQPTDALSAPAFL